MTSGDRYQLTTIEYPDFGQADPPRPPEVAEWSERLDRARQAMELSGFSHLLVYGDREHFANLAYLSGYDPRFEEALLVLSKADRPLLITGLEGVGYLGISPLYNAGLLRSECYPPFSIQDSPRGPHPSIRELLRNEGIRAGSRVGVVGWKTYSEAAGREIPSFIDAPAYLVDAVREIAGQEGVVNATRLFLGAEEGLRTVCSAAEIAYFEFSNVLASEGIKNLLFGLRDGLQDFEAARLLGFAGLPLNCHHTLAFGKHAALGLSSPSGAVMHRGDPLTTNFGYWGSNICRAGWVAAGAHDLPEHASGYIPEFAGPYFEAMAEWLAGLRIGASAGDLVSRIERRLPFGRYGIALNPGHFTHLDEWVGSPFTSGSAVRLRSGMALQSDVIPYSPIYFSTRMEDGWVLADPALRAELQARYPACYARCMERQRFVQNTLGIAISDELLPLSNIPAIVPPFFLQPQLVFTLEA